MNENCTYFYFLSDWKKYNVLFGVRKILVIGFVLLDLKRLKIAVLDSNLNLKQD